MRKEGGTRADRQVEPGQRTGYAVQLLRQGIKCQAGKELEILPILRHKDGGDEMTWLKILIVVLIIIWIIKTA